jgi:hypothetical protein
MRIISFLMIVMGTLVGYGMGWCQARKALWPQVAEVQRAVRSDVCSAGCRTSFCDGDCLVFDGGQVVRDTQ